MMGVHGVQGRQRACCAALVQQHGWHRLTPNPAVTTSPATGSKDNTVSVWDAAARRCVFSMSNHMQAVTAVKWGGEGLIYSASRDCR
jgi:ribosome assembly protein 4